MSLPVSPPEPPTLRDVDPNEYDDAEVVGQTDYRRDELNDLLADGAWTEAFETWRETTQLDASEWEIVTDLDLVSRFDFFWDDFAGRVGYHAPGLPEDWKERDLHPELESWATVSSINAGLTELGQQVCDTLLEEYIGWESEFDAPDDLPDFEI